MVAHAPASGPRRQQAVILVTLLVLTAAAWVLLLRWPDSMRSGMGSMGAAGGTQSMSGDMTSGLTAGLRAPLFLVMWTVMMVAMMFPAAAPMILSFARIQSGKRQHGQVFVPTWIFIAGYLLVWSAAGAVAFVLASAGGWLAGRSMFLTDNAARIGGLALVLAGVYQYTPLKSACLTKCRTPLQFILMSWRDGRRGALRMGLEHGIFCLGCCWLFFVILFPLGIMNLAAMALITLVICVEKVLPVWRPVSIFTAALLIGYGLLVVAHPAALLTTV